LNTRLTEKREKIFSILLRVSGISIIIITSGIFLTLLINSIPSLKHNGIFDFIFSVNWNPIENTYGILPFIVGTLATSIVALVICIPFSLSIALFLGEYYKNGKLSMIVRSSVEIMAGIPSVIYGFWALYVLIPLVIKLQIFLKVIPYGAGIFTASIVLGIMIIPYASVLAGDSVERVPGHLKEAAYSLGATRAEVIRKVVLPNAFSGILAGIILALGRALGETMVVAMVIGNSSAMPESIFSLGNTLSSLIANEFVEAESQVHRSALIHAGAVLFLITLVINLTGKFLAGKYKGDY